MTKSYKNVHYGLEEETGLWFAYSGSSGNVFANSKVSQLDAILKLCNGLTNKLENVEKAMLNVYDEVEE